MIILTIDTTGASASVTIFNERKELFAELSSDTMSHLQMLIPMVERVIKKAGVLKTEITHIAAVVGPGSFTGIRIGLATAKTLAQAWDLPMIAISSLAAFSYAIPKPRTMVCPMIDARHGQVFAGAFSSIWEEKTQPAAPERWKAEDVWPAEEFIQAAVSEAVRSDSVENVVFCGDAAEKYLEEIDKAVHRAEKSNVKVTFLDQREFDSVRAAAVAQMARRMAEEGLTVTYDAIEPVYLRKSEAERKLEAKELGKKKKDERKEEIVFEMPPADETITYRKAKLQDGSAFAGLDRLCFRNEWNEAAFNGELDGGKNAVYIAAENSKGEIVGFAGAAFVSDEGEINRVAVHPLYRGRGIADHMMTALMEESRYRGAASLYLEVREANRSAIALYKNHGFRVTGKREGYYAETGENALLMNWSSDEKDE